MRKYLLNLIFNSKTTGLIPLFFCLTVAGNLNATTHIITAQGMTFTPNNVNCVVGDTIKFQWVNGSHTTTSVSVPAGAASWNQNLNSSSTSYKYVITQAGTYNYHCNFHYLMGMTGVLNAVAPLSAAISPFANVSCTGGSNGSATASPAGGASPYTYSWNPGGKTTAAITGLSTGTYTVTVTDAEAEAATASVTISQPASLPAITIASHTNVDCHGNSTGSITANAATGGTSPYTYAWTPSGGTNLTASNLSANTYTITVTDNHGCTATASVIISQPSSSPGITLSTHTNVNCNGNSTGNATANAATGGTSPYTYAWTPSGGTNLTISNLSANTYTITVTDNHGCTATASVNITQPALLSITIASQANVDCNGNSTGSAAANAATGGTSPYTYAWSPNGSTGLTASNLTFGTYTITVTDKNSCTGSASATITQPASALGITMASHADINCNGGTGSATASAATGGTSPYTYAWTPTGGNALTASNITAGIYTITVTDNHSCSASASVTITEPASASGITIAGHTDVRCYGNNTGSATANAATGGTSPYTYTWAPSGGTNLFISSLPANTYTITATDNHGCATSASVAITQPNPLSEITATTANAPCCNNNNGSGNITASDGTSPYTYSWSNGNTTSSISGLSGGTYTVTLQDNCGVSIVDNIIITQPATLSSAAITNSNVTCNGLSNGSASANASGGALPYTYSWSNGSSTVSILPSPSALSAGNYTITLTDNCGGSVTASISITEPPALSITTTVTPVTCAGGGSATASVSGGVSPYTYLWSDANSQTTATALGLATGTYTLTLTDFNGCTDTASVFIGIASGISVSASITANVSCNGGNSGAATANVSGGATPYTYVWSDGNSQATIQASGLSAGNYTVNVTDNNSCTGSASVSISQPNQLSVVTSLLSAITCYGTNNGSASSTVTGGTSPYMYAWTNGGTNASVNNLTSGTYSVIVTDSCGATATASIFINQPPVLNVTGVLLSNVSCNGGLTGAVTQSVSGGTGPYTYEWSPTFNPETGPYDYTGIPAGSYTVIVIDDNGCTASASINVTQPNAITISGDSTNDDGSCNGKAWAVVGGGTNPYTYVWTGGGTTDTIKNQCFGSYCCVVTDANGCLDSVCVIINLSTGSGKLTVGNGQLLIYPNPGNGLFNVIYHAGTPAGGEESLSITVYNELGQNVLTVIRPLANNNLINLSAQPNGVYFYRITKENGSLSGEGKLIIEK